MTKKRLHVYISGRVQGVFFRATTRRKASELGIKGWVKNLADGRVEAVFEGEEDKLKKILNWSHQGPSRADVDNVETHWKEYQGDFAGFNIRY